MSPSTSSKVTTDHDEIRRWAEVRGAQPAAVVRTESDDDPSGIRLNFRGIGGDRSLEPISWDDWFRKFDKHRLALLYQEHTANGDQSNFNKIISRETAEEAERSTGGKGRSATHKGASSDVKRPGSQLHATSRQRKEGRAEVARESSSTRSHGASTGRAVEKPSASSRRASSSSGSLTRAGEVTPPPRSRAGLARTVAPAARQENTRRKK